VALPVFAFAFAESPPPLATFESFRQTANVHVKSAKPTRSRKHVRKKLARVLGVVSNDSRMFNAALLPMQAPVGELVTDRDDWQLEQLHLECPRRIYNQGWDGYRLADMMQSRYQRRTASGLTYHLRKFPRSIVADFLTAYKCPSPRNNRYSARYEQLTKGACHPGSNLSVFNASSCGDERVAPELQCCPYILPVSALTDIVRRRREKLGTTPLPLTAAVHLRLGEVVDLSPCTVDDMMARYTRFQRECRANGKVWTGTACMRQTAFEYVMPRSFFEFVRAHLADLRVRRVVLVAGSALNLTAGFRKSCDYLSRVATFFLGAGFQVSYRLGRPPDDDVMFFSRVTVVVPSGGSYSRYATRAAAAFGVQVLSSNRSEPLKIGEVKHGGGQWLKYVC